MPPLSSFPISQRTARGYGPAFANKFAIDIVAKTKEAMNYAMNHGVGAATDEARAMGAALNQYRSGKGGARSLASVHQDLARKAQIATLAAYDATTVPHLVYRVGQNRYAGGALRRALANPDMFVGSYGGIVFMNIAILNAEARHWARLNYGAGGKANEHGDGIENVVLKLFGEVVGVVNPGNRPSKAFGIPPGVWVGSQTLRKRAGAGEDTEDTQALRSVRIGKFGDKPPGFYPTRMGPMRETAGIAGRHFFDAAFESLEENFPLAYEDLLRQWIDQAVRTGKGPAAAATINSLTRFLG